MFLIVLNMFYVYILKSLKNGRYYTGQTNDIKRRLHEHNIGNSRYTRSTKPFTILTKEKYQTRKEAIQRERFLKTGQGRTWIKNNFG